MGAADVAMGLATGSGMGRIGAGGTGTAVDGEAAAGVADGAAGEAAGTIRETFFEMNAVDLAFRVALPPGSWTRYQSPCTARSWKTVPAPTRAMTGLV
jgi:hypothetical protein